MDFSYQIFILFLGGLTAGFVDAISGGGGLISLPLLMALGVQPHLALGTNKLQSSFGTSMATYNYYKNGFISVHILLKGLVFGVVGALLGSLSAQHVSTQLLQQVIPFLMILVFMYFVFSPRKIGLDDRDGIMKEPYFYMLFGFLLSFYDGFLGPGVGSFWVVCLVFFLGYNMAKASAYTKVFNLKSNLIAAVCFILAGNVNYKIALCMACGQLIGGKLGSHVVIKKGARLVRPVFLSVVFLTIVSLLVKRYVFHP